MLTQKQWQELCRLNEVPGFEGLREKVEQTHEFWPELLQSQAPETLEMPIEGLSDF